MDYGTPDPVVGQTGQEHMGMTDTASSSKQQRPPSKPIVVSVIAGIVVFLLLAAAGIVVSSNSSTQWVARSSALVLPAKPVNPAHLPGYYETLSRGQIVTTLAELVRLGEFQTEVADQFGLSDSQREFVALTVSVVPDTAMLSVVATSEDPDLAAAMVDGVVQAATRYIGDLTLPYALVPVTAGANNLSESGQSTAVVIGVFTLAALVAGLVVQQATLQLMKLTEQRNPDRDHSAPKGPPDDGARSVAEAPDSAKH
jgi:hypothetical protein